MVSIALLGMGFLGHAAGLPELQKILNSSKSPDSVEAFIQRMPQEFFAESALVYDSLGRSRAYVSGQNPRIILSNPDSSVFVSYTTHPKDPLRQNIEVIARSGSSFRFLEANFMRGKRSQFTPSSKCVGCHMGRPNWSAYPQWTGMYGEHTELIGLERRGGFDQASQFVALWKNRGNEPRFKRVRARSRLALSQSLRRITQSLAFQNADRISRIVRSNRNYKKYKYALAASMICGSNGQAGYRVNYFVPSFDQFLPLRFQKPWMTWLRPGQEPDRDQGVAYRWVLDRMGVNLSELSMRYRDDFFPDPTTDRYFTIPTGPVYDYLPGSIFKDDPSMKRFFYFFPGTYEDGIPAMTLATAAGNLVCEELKVLSKRALE